MPDLCFALFVKHTRLPTTAAASRNTNVDPSGLGAHGSMVWRHTVCNIYIFAITF